MMKENTNLAARVDQELEESRRKQGQIFECKKEIAAWEVKYKQVINTYEGVKSERNNLIYTLQQVKVMYFLFCGPNCLAII